MNAEQIEQEYPLNQEFAEDARYVWPERWRKLKAEHTKLCQVAKKVVLVFPESVNNEAEFNIPAYIIDELRAAITTDIAPDTKSP